MSERLPRITADEVIKALDVWGVCQLEGSKEHACAKACLPHGTGRRKDAKKSTGTGLGSGYHRNGCGLV